MASSLRGVTSEKMVNRAMVHLSPAVRPCAKGCMASRWILASVVNNPIRAPSSTQHLSPIWGAAGDDLLEPQYLWHHKWQPTIRKPDIQGFKKRTPLQGDPYKKYFSSGDGVSRTT
jgi:hypothetical protein